MELWTTAHLQTIPPALAVMLLICILLRKWLGKKDLHIRMIPMQIIAVILVLIEIGKQAVSFSKGYDLYHIPLHFCSLFLFVLPVMAFYKGKYANQVAAIGAALSSSLFALMLIYPNLIYSAGNIKNFFDGYLDFHTVFFHNLVMLAFMLIIALDLHTPAEKGEPKLIVLFLTGFCAVSAIAAQLLETNYANFYRCNIPILEELRLWVQSILGYSITQVIYVLILTCVNYVFVLAFYWLYRGMRKLASRPEKEPILP